MKRLIFHIGDPKTGSTSIQNTFATRSVRFPSDKVYYPLGKNELNHNHLLQKINKVIKQRNSKQGQEAARYLDNLASKIASSGADYCLISGEILSGLDAAEFRKVIERHFSGIAEQIRVLSYCRPHASRFLSSYAEQIKIGGFHGEIEEFFTLAAKQKRFRYAQRYGQWKKQFGDDYLLRPMVRGELVEGSLFDDFIRSAFGEVDFVLSDSLPANESLGVEQLTLLRMLQKRLQGPFSKQMRHAVGWEFSRLFGEFAGEQKSTRMFLPRSVAEKIGSTFLEDAIETDRQFFDGSPLLQGELERSVQNASDQDLRLDPALYFSAAELGTIQVLMEFTLGILKRKECAPWAPYIRKMHVLPVLAGTQVNDN